MAPETNQIHFSKDWVKVGDGADYVFFPVYAGRPSFAVKIHHSISGPKLELMTMQETDNMHGGPSGEWKPAKTTLLDDPQKVIALVESFQSKMGAEWSFNGDAEIFEHESEYFYAQPQGDQGRLNLYAGGKDTDFSGSLEEVFREGERRVKTHDAEMMRKEWWLDRDTGIYNHESGGYAARPIKDGSGQLELGHARNAEGEPGFTPLGKPFIGAPEAVFQEGINRESTRRAVFLGDIDHLFSTDWNCKMEGVYPRLGYTHPTHNSPSFAEYAPPGISRPSFAVERIETPEGTKLQLLTQQVTEHGEIMWLPAKTPYVGAPQAVIQEIERRQQGIDQNWHFNGDTEYLMHRGGNIAARSIEGDTTRLELMRVHIDPEKGLQCEPLQTPFIGSRENVFQEGEKRHVYLTEIKEGKRFPNNYTESKDHEGVKIGIHSSNQFAVRNAGEGKLEILTPKKTERGKLWSAAEKAFKDWPFRVYAEVNRRVHVAAQAVKKAVGRTGERGKMQSREL